MLRSRVTVYMCLGGAVGLGVFFNIVFAFGAEAGFLRTFATTSMLSGASLLGAWVLGLLFGIPRSFQGLPGRPTQWRK